MRATTYPGEGRTSIWSSAPCRSQAASAQVKRPKTSNLFVLRKLLLFPNQNKNSINSPGGVDFLAGLRANVDENQSVIWPMRMTTMMISFRSESASCSNKSSRNCTLRAAFNSFQNGCWCSVASICTARPLHEHILISPWNCGTTKRCR